mmetsp:Transcript_21032/g.56619  ORF Transcript_21032/g.56619 Transcript_21032/m.56619 type:complete len:201 (+) Transcript_21032:496-1098(+)
MASSSGATTRRRSTRTCATRRSVARRCSTRCRVTGSRPSSSRPCRSAAPPSSRRASSLPPRPPRRPSVTICAIGARARATSSCRLASSLTAASTACQRAFATRCRASAPAVIGPLLTGCRLTTSPRRRWTRPRPSWRRSSSWPCLSSPLSESAAPRVERVGSRFRRAPDGGWWDGGGLLGLGLVGGGQAAASEAVKQKDC